MKRHTTRFALLAGVCAAGLALSACDDEPTQAEKTPKTGDQMAADRAKPDAAKPDAANPDAKTPERTETDQRRGDDRAEAPDTGQTPTAPGSGQMKYALKGKSGRDMGTVTVSRTEGDKEGVTVRIEARNLPAGEHAVHFHEKGVCEEPSFESAGEHWRPTDWNADANKGIDPGHLGTVTADDEGTAKKTFGNEYARLATSGPNSLSGANGVSVVIHAQADDNGAQPGGNAGGRLACAVVRPPQKDPNQTQ